MEYSLFLEPPSRPRSPQAEFKDSNSVIITWEPPSDLGGRSDYSYRISCSGTTSAAGSSVNQCPSQSIQYSPAQSGFNTTKVTISNLLPDTHYTFLIFAENGVSTQVQNLPQYAAVPVTTDRLGKLLAFISAFCLFSVMVIMATLF